jgi:hypothetical protein
MKTYIIELLTSQGPVKENYTDDPQNENFELLTEFENRMKNKHGDFIMLSCKEI